MSGLQVRRVLVAMAVCIVSGSALALPAAYSPPRGTPPIPLRPRPLPPQQDPDAYLYTTYSFWSAYQDVNWVVCGSTQYSSGCYQAGRLGPFGHVGALMEGNKQVAGNTVTRDVYVVDDAASGGSGVVLYDYLKTDVVTLESDSVSIVLKKSVTMPYLVGGAGATSYMAGNANFLFVGTSLSTSAVEVRKSDLAAGPMGGFSPPEDVTAITSDGHGNVTITFRDPVNPGLDGFYVYGPSGSLEEDGGGGDFVLNATQGFSTGGLPPSVGNSAVVTSPSMRMPIRLKRPARAIGMGN